LYFVEQSIHNHFEVPLSKDMWIPVTQNSKMAL